VEPILPENGISGITPFARKQTQIGAESIKHSAPKSNEFGLLIPSLDRLAPNHPVYEAVANVLDPMLSHKGRRDENREQQASTNYVHRRFSEGHS
jgi:hypothetical protein